jgi:biopolymer transport protein ExbD
MKRHRQDLEIISNINITNLLDTAFILLIAFMIVAPTLKSGIPVQLPKVDDSQALDEMPDAYTISLRPKDVESVADQIFVNGKRVHLDELGPLMEKAHTVNPDVAVMIRADSAALAGTLVKVIDKVSGVGIENFAFLTEPLPKVVLEKGRGD